MHDIQPRRIAWIGAGLAATVGLCVAAVFLLLWLWAMPPGGARLTPDAQPKAANPVLESAPQMDLERYRADKRRLLDSTGWVDAKAGIAHIPIATAMALLASPAASAASAPEGKP